MPVAAIRPSRTPTPLGRRVRELRQAAGLTQAALAERTGGRVTRDYLKGLEAGRYTNIGLELFEAIAEVLGLSLDELRYGPTAAPAPATPAGVPADERSYLVRTAVFPVVLLDALERIGVTIYFSRLEQPGAPQHAEGEKHECHREVPYEGHAEFGPE